MNLRKIFIALAAFGVVCMLVYYYLFVLVPAKESELNSRGFRILNRMEQNIYEKKGNVVKTISLFYNKNADVEKALLEGGDKITSLKNDIFFDGFRLSKKINHNTWVKNYKRNYFLPSYNTQENTWNFLFFDLIPNDRDSSVAVYQYDLEKFLHAIVDHRKDFFEDFVILQNGKIIYQTCNIAFGADSLQVSKLGKKKGGVLLSDYLKRDTLGGKMYYSFYHSFDKSSDVNFVICGLISTEKYNKDRYLLNTDQILWTSLFFLIAAVSLPFIKIFSVSKFERLLHSDIIRLGVALVIGASLLTIAILLNTYTAVERERQQNEIKALSFTIERRFENEIKKVLEEFKVHENAILNKVNDYKEWIVENALNDHAISNPIAKYFNNDSSKHYTEGLLLINKNGDNWAAWLETNRNSPDPNLATRDYVKVYSDKPDGLVPMVLESQSFFLQPIYSWLDQKNMVMVSKKVDDKLNSAIANIQTKCKADIIGLETNLASLMNTAAPDEIQFCILDHKGNVLFHTIENRNLRENFSEETGKNDLIQTAIQTRMDTTVNVHYYGHEHLAHIRPMKNLPYFVVTLYEKTFFLDALSNQVTFAISMLFLLGLLIALIFVITYFATRRVTFLKRQKINIKWLRFNTVNANGFIVLTCFLLIPTALSFFFMKGFSLRFISFLLPLFTLVLAAAVIFKINRKYYSANHYKSSIINQYRVFFLCCLAAMFLLLAVLGYLYPSQWINSCRGILGLVIFIFTLLLAVNPNLLSNPFSLKLVADNTPVDVKELYAFVPAEKSYKYCFAVFAIILLLYNLSIFPSINFFLLSVRQERKLMQKRNSLEVAQKTENRDQWIKTVIDKRVKTDINLLRSGIYACSDELVSINPLDVSASVTKSISPEDFFTGFYLRVINLPNISYDSYELRSIFMNRNVAADTSAFWLWNDRTLHYKFPTVGNQKADLTGVSIHLPFHRNSWAYLTPASRVVLIISILIVVILLYSCLLYIYRKLFLVEYFTAENEMSRLREGDREYIEQNVTRGGTNLLVISLPGTRVLDVIISAITKDGFHEVNGVEKLKEVCINCLCFKPNTKNDELSKIIVLPFFDLKATDSKNCQTQLQALHESFSNPKTKVIWITSSDPSEQVSILSKNALELLKLKEKNKEPITEVDMIDQEKDKILQLLDDFEKILYALEDNLHEDGKLLSGDADTTPFTSKYIEDEFRFGNYFVGLRKNVVGTKILKSFFNEDTGRTSKYKNAEELFILKIQDMAQSYYFSLWASLNSKEKYVLYDMALDELTNYKNFNVLADLEQKGILYFCNHDHTLKIFNKSFRNFILTVVDPEEALLLEKQINLTGTWETIRIVLVIFFVSIGLFLFITEQTVFNRVIGFTTAITSLTPVIISFFANVKGAKLAK